MNTTLLIMAAGIGSVSEQELNSWSRLMMLTISSWTTQFMMQLRLDSTM